MRGDRRHRRNEDPDKTICLQADWATMSFREFAILLARGSMAPVDKKFNPARRRIKALARVSRPISGMGPGM